MDYKELIEKWEEVMSYLEDEIAIYENLSNIMPSNVECYVSDDSRKQYEMLNTIYELLEPNEELERLAEIGRATERFAEEGYFSIDYESMENQGVVKCRYLHGVDELIGWYMEEKEG